MRHFIRPGKSGFTRTELVAVITILSLLTLCAIPTLGQGQESSSATACLANVRKWARSWTLHALDNDGVYATATRLTGTIQRPYWVDGWLDYSSQRQHWDPTVNLSLSPLLPYIEQYDHRVWRCPSDPSRVRTATRAWAPRVRTYSMSHAFDNGSWLPSPPYRVYAKISDVVKPSLIWAYMDEHPDSINDAVLAVQMYTPGSPRIVDFPASLHNGAVSLSYVDGSAELHRWRHPKMKPPVLGVPMALNVPLAGADEDLIWLSERTTVRR